MPIIHVCIFYVYIITGFPECTALSIFGPVHFTDLKSGLETSRHALFVSRPLFESHILHIALLQMLQPMHILYV